MPRAKNKLTPDQLGELIYEIRGERVMLDSNLASIYGVTTKRLNEQVRRNRERFPNDFAFQLTNKETRNLRSQIATSSSHGGSAMRSQIATASRRNIRYRPWASPSTARSWPQMSSTVRAVQMSVFVVRAFLKMRALLGDKRDLARQLASLEKDLKKRLDAHETVIITILQRVMDIIDPPALPSSPLKPQIGFKP